MIREQLIGGAFISKHSSFILAIWLELANGKSIFIEPYDSNWSYLQATIKGSSDINIYVNNFLINNDLDTSNIYRLASV